MTRSSRSPRTVPLPDAAAGRSPQHISSIAHLFFSEDGVETSGLTPDEQCRRFLVVGSGKSSLAPNLAAGLVRAFLAAGDKVEAEPRSGRDTTLRQVFLGEPSLVHFSAFNHLPQENCRLPRPEETVPWTDHSGFASTARVFAGIVPGEDFTAGRGQSRFYVRHMDLPRERQLGALEAQQASGQETDVTRDATQGLIWCLTEEDGPSLLETSRLGRLLRVARPASLHVVQVQREGREKEEHRRRAERLVRFVAGEVPVAWHGLGPDREERLSLQRELARRLGALDGGR